MRNSGLVASALMALAVVLFLLAGFDAGDDPQDFVEFGLAFLGAGLLVCHHDRHAERGRL